MTGSDTATAAAHERALDTVLADSFPASDPPSWTFGKEPEHVLRVPRSSTGAPAPIRRQHLATGIEVISTGLAAIALALLFPLLIVGVPMALLWRAALSATVWREPDPGRS